MRNKTLIYLNFGRHHGCFITIIELLLRNNKIKLLSLKKKNIQLETFSEHYTISFTE